MPGHAGTRRILNCGVKNARARSDKSSQGPTGRELPARVAGKNPVTGEEQGQLVRYPPGSNGGTRRGPDLQPRRVVPAIILKALSEEDELALPPASKRSGAAKRKRARARAAMVDNTARALRRIMLHAVEGIARPSARPFVCCRRCMT